MDYKTIQTEEGLPMTNIEGKHNERSRAFNNPSSIRLTT